MRVLVLAIFLFPFYALADYSGTWTADEMQMVTKKGDTYICDELTINVNQQVDKITFGKFTYACGNFAFTFTPPTLRLDGEKVYFKNKYNDYIGTLTDKEVHLTYVINDKNGRTRITVKRVSDTELDYLDEEIDVDPNTGKDVEMTIHAVVKKVN